MDEDTRLVPVVKLEGKEFLVDIEKREFINTDNLSHCISMHSQKGRDMVRAMVSMEWRCFVAYPGRQDGMEV